MVEIVKYKTFLDYENATGIYKILYSVRDSITSVNPFFVILFGFMLVLTIASYFSSITLVGKSRLFNSLTASSFATFVVSIFFSLASLISPYVVLLFIGLTILFLTLSIFYR